ncbi:InlB B-repeat-containing protein [Legionella worsleiensis]|uniref:Bacterial repeat domain-containing protein n=1 Tax=Legionella worsleiensis TaxID=45076 RepID=A0A0W1AJY3_9GAMM|nr:hypothetical protein [Legionella worsleiensis]KTD81604.1 hypothetical protein Lwor_0386 [Legionella worsleiensis]STY31987.1 transmembrane protein (fibronectin III domain and Gp5 C-terminal repeat) [Legionella worsleiensis]
MHKLQGFNFRLVISTFFLFFFLCFVSSAQAGIPVWTFSPLTATDLTVSRGSTEQVVYTVHNQSTSSKRLFMKNIPGITQTQPCQLPAKGTCTLTLIINGSALQGDVLGGPILCQQGNSLMCYRPSEGAQLRIRLTDQPPVIRYSVLSVAGANGAITPAGPLLVNEGSSLAFTATPNANFGVDQWFLDGNVVQNGGVSYQLNNIQANHTVEVTFNQTTLSPLTQDLVLSINSTPPTSDPALVGNPRIIRIQNTGTVDAQNVQVSPTAFPAGTSITSNTCTGTLNAGATCDVTITPGGTASSNVSATACNTAPGSVAVPTIVTISADNAAPVDINVSILGYGCIYEGGYLFAVDDTTPNTGSIGGKVAALTDEVPDYQWATVFDNTAANSLLDGLTNTNALTAPIGQYPAAQICFNKIDQGLTDWFLPAICELGRFVGINTNAGCGNARPNLYSTLHVKGLGNFAGVIYWSSSEYVLIPATSAWAQFFGFGDQFFNSKAISSRVRCIRTFTP